MKKSNIRKDNAKLIKALTIPGVDLKMKKNVPYYHMDEDANFIRMLNGKKHIVKLVDGKIIIVKKLKKIID